jgi:DNA-directed RNA polymerase specialized sigma24 family protein
VDKIFNAIFPEVDKICQIITKGDDLKDDLTQEVMIDLLKKGKDEIQRLYNSNEILPLCFKIAYSKWHFNNGREVGEKNNACFKAVFRDAAYNHTDIDKYKYSLVEEVTIEPTHQLDDALRQINSFERMILIRFMELGCNMNQYSKDTGISRQHLTERINKILNKCKKLSSRY